MAMTSRCLTSGPHNRTKWLACLLVVIVSMFVVRPVLADSLCKPAAPSSQSKCQKDAQCCAGLVCQASACRPGCRIGGVFYVQGTVNPANPCQVCQPAASTTSWTNRADGATCSDGNACTIGDTCRVGSCRSGDTPDCQNGGTCINGGSSYTCQCAPGFTGASCQINMDDCSPNPCQNGGTCTDGIASYTCQCTPGFTGANCQTDINECLAAPCDSNATCSNTPGSFSCACNSGYTGDGFTCADIDECLAAPCGANATCNNLPGSFSCACSPGFDNCNGADADGCETPLNTLTDCGLCGQLCTRDNASASCQSGSCVIESCDTGFGDCDGVDTDGCETPLNTLSDCGVCGGACDDANSCTIDSCATGECKQIDGAACETPACSGGQCPIADSDGDGLNDTWETNGYIDLNCNGAYDPGVDTPLPEADANRPNIYVKYDYMSTSGTGEHSHQPSSAALDLVRNAFLAQNVILTFYPTFDAIPEQRVVTFDPVDASCTGPGAVSFYTIKAAHFPAFLRPAYHYALFAHLNTCDQALCTQCPASPATGLPPRFGTLGVAERPGNDLIVSLGTFVDASIPVTDEMNAGTFMHELGHNVNLHHGGGDDLVQKPNYFSVMNYSYQFGIPVSPSPGPFPTSSANPAVSYRIDYSGQALGTLREGILGPGGCESDGSGGMDEAIGIQGNPLDSTDITVFYTAPGSNQLFAPSNGTPVDWDNVPPATGTGVYADVSGDGLCSSLNGFNDWASVPSSLPFQCRPTFIDGLTDRTLVEWDELDFETASGRLPESHCESDNTPPTITFGASAPAANLNGWNNTDVAILYTASDACGVASVSPASPLLFSSEGANQTRTVTACDHSANCATAVSPAVSIDKTIPSLTSLILPRTLVYGAFFNITATATDPAPASGFTLSSMRIPEWAAFKAFTHNFEVDIVDVWTQRALRLGFFTVKWSGTDGADNERDPDVKSGLRLPDTPGAFAGAFLEPVPSSRYELERSLPIKFRFVDVEGNPLPEFCGRVVVDQAPAVHRVLDAPWNGTECQVNEQLAEDGGYHVGPVTVSLPRDDDAVLGYTRSITIEIK